MTGGQVVPFTVIKGGNRTPIVARKPQPPPEPSVTLAKKIEQLRFRKPVLAHLVEGMVDRLLAKS